MAVIPKPDHPTFTTALNNAELLRETGNDHHHIGHALLYLEERSRLLEAVAIASEAYIRFGEDAQLHTNLVKALQALEDYEREAIPDEALPVMGLDQV
ncbi:hypothetical protein [Methylophaga sp.]|uniref:hypothetical protein n=1 Tax=Methylophaga sp. TaxID=2024840 RepID=UPI003F69FEE1